MDDVRLKQAAQMYEHYFLNQMLKSMRTTLPGQKLVPEGQAEKIFQEQLDDQYAGKWTEAGGIGFADLILEKLKEGGGK